MSCFDYLPLRPLRFGLLASLTALCGAFALPLACSGTVINDSETDGAFSAGISTATGGSNTSIDSTSSPSTNPSGDTFTDTGTNIYTGTGTICAYESTACEQSCCALWSCIQSKPWLCEGLFDSDLDDFNYVAGGTECILSCEDNPAFLSASDPDDCEGTIKTFRAADSDFDQECKDG